MNADKILKVLLVEDNDSDAVLLLDSILTAGVEDISISRATSLEEAINHLRSNSTDAVLLDLSLPDSNGLSTVSHVRRFYSELPVVVLTGMDDEKTGMEAVRMGVQDYLVKGQADGRFIIRAIRYAIERKQAQEKLRQTTEMLELAQEGADVGTFEWNIRTNEMKWSASEEKLYGLPTGVFEGRFDDWRRRVHPEDAGNLDAIIQSAVRAAAPLAVEFRIIRSDGQVRWIAAKARVFVDSGGVPVRIVGVNIDITERKQLEDELRKANENLETKVRERTSELADAVVMLQEEVEEREKMQKALIDSELKYRELVENANSIIMRRDADGKVTFFNEFAQKFFGFSEKEIIGRNIIGTIVPKTQTAERDMKALIAQINKDHQAYQSNESENVRKDGSRVWIAWTNKAIVDEQEKVAELLCVGNDITAHKHAEEERNRLSEALEQRADQLRRLNSELMEVERRERHRLAQVLHDHLQQMLVGARLKVSYMERTVNDPAIRFSLKQIDEVLDQSINTSRTLTVELSPPVLHEDGFIAALDWLQSHMQEKYDLAVTVKAVDGVDVADDDCRFLLFEAVRELLFNIIKHAKTKKAEVRVSRLDAARVKVEVSDEGIGFDLAKFGARKSSSDGFGLFSISERLGLLDGSIDVQSTPGQGTCVTLLVPLKRKTSQK